MVTYTVHEPPNPPADRLDRAQAVVFLKDGFNLGATLLGPVWLLARRLWIGFALYAVGLGVLLGFLKAMGASPGWFSLVIAAVHVLIGFSAVAADRCHQRRCGASTRSAGRPRGIVRFETAQGLREQILTHAARRHYRLRVGQSALGHEGVRTGGA